VVNTKLQVPRPKHLILRPCVSTKTPKLQWKTLSTTPSTCTQLLMYVLLTHSAYLSLYIHMYILYTNYLSIQIYGYKYCRPLTHCETTCPIKMCVCVCTINVYVCVRVPSYSSDTQTHTRSASVSAWRTPAEACARLLRLPSQGVRGHECSWRGSRRTCTFTKHGS
jgi:hypothetical protein